MDQHHDIKHNLLQFIEAKSSTIVVLNSFIILFVTLLPFDFTFPDNFSWDYIRIILTTVSPPGDILVNLALFIPFGWGLTALLITKKFKYVRSILLTLIFSFCLSLTVETLQIFSLLRMTTPTDLLSNSLSGVLGGAIFLLVRNQLKRINFYFDKKRCLQVLMIIWLIYLITISFSLFFLKDATKLNNWNTQFPLIIGNEKTGNRPWQGEISYFYISDRFLSEATLEKILSNNNNSQILQTYLSGNYIFNHQQSIYIDQLGNLPNLVWQVDSQVNKKQSATELNKNNWLKTEYPPKKLTKKIQENSQFTIVTKIKSNQKSQNEKGARIFSFSDNIYQRNLSLEQSGANLKLRLRTTLTGNNGRNPEFILRNFFNDLQVHIIAIAYNSRQLKIYIDNVENIYDLKLNSEVALFWSILHVLGSRTPIYISRSALYDFLYHDLLFVPFGFLLSLILTTISKNLRLYLIIFLAGIIVPPLVIEMVVVFTGNGSWNFVYLVGSILAVAITTLLFKTLITLKI